VLTKRIYLAQGVLLLHPIKKVTMITPRLMGLLIATLLLVNCFAATDTTTNLVPKQMMGGLLMTTLSTKMIKTSYGKTVGQLLTEQAGMVISGALQPIGSLMGIYMEGVLSGRVLILLDGIPVSDPSTIGEYFDLNFISLNEIEEINIYRGAQSTLFGEGAFAGVINIITLKKNNNKLLNMEASQNVGNQNTFKSSVNIWGNNKRIKYDMGYTKITTQGFSYAHDSTATNNFDKDDYWGNILKTNVAYNINSKLTINARCLYSSYKTLSDADDFIDDKYLYYNNRIVTTGAGFDYKSNKWLIVGNYQYANNLRGYYFSSTNHEHYGGTLHTADIFVTNKLTQHFTLLLGVNYKFGHLKYYSFDSAAGTNFIPYANTHQYSLYGYLSYKTKDSCLVLNAGGRTIKHSAYGNTQVLSIDGYYRVNKTFKSFASVSTAIKSPSNYQLYDNGYGNVNLAPEKTLCYRVGITANIKNFVSRLEVYYKPNDQLISYNDNVNLYENFGSIKVLGVEYSFDLPITPLIAINGNYTLLSGKETTNNRTNFMDTTTYPYLVNRPKHVANLQLKYNNNHLQLGINARFSGSFYNVYYGYQDVLMPSYIYFCGYASYQFNKHVAAYTSAQNLFNTTFFDVRGYNSIPLLLEGGIAIEL